MMDGWGDGGYGWGGFLIEVLFVALIVVGVVLLARGTRGPGRDATPGPGSPMEPPPEGARASSPLDVLEERYARGEIDREEFLQRREDLSSMNRP